MKKEIKFPKGATGINFDLVNGVATAIYESETAKKLNRRKELKPTYEVGKWYKSNKVDEIALVLDDKFHHVSFQNGEFVEMNSHVVLPSSEKRAWKPANMDEVEKLLINKAQKDYPRGVVFNSPYEDCKVNPIICTGNLFYELGSLNDSENNVIFDEETGKWAEIIEEKKPLYTNSLGTEFFEGDDYSFVHIKTLNIRTQRNLHSGIIFSESEGYTEIMTKEQAEQYIKDHTTKLYRVDLMSCDIVKDHGQCDVSFTDTMTKEQAEQWVKDHTPLYINNYGRKYFDGDKYRYYVYCMQFIVADREITFSKNNLNLNGSLIADFVGTKKECYQYLTDHCKE